MPRLRLAWLALAASAGPALAHGGAHPLPQDPPGWTWDPAITLPLLLSAGLYLAGAVRLFGRARRGRRRLSGRIALFACGWLLLAVATVSPLHEAGERSFTLHMIEHEIIMLPAALLLATSSPIATMLWALPRALRSALAGAGRSPWIAAPWRFLTDPVVATLMQGAAMVVWHVPALFDRALGHAGWHIAQHLSFLLTALLFWWSMTRPRNRGAAAVCLFLTSLLGGALGALMALSSSPWYAGYAAMGMAPFGLTPTEDQAFAGLVMWVPGGLVHAGAALLLIGRYVVGARAAPLPLPRNVPAH